MKIKHLRIKNFAIYKDVDIDLSTEDGGLVLFQGENSAGKTTVFAAIKWCLYGETTKDKRKLALEDLFNRDVEVAAHSDPDIKVEVTLTWESNGVDYEMTRRVWFENGAKKPTQTQKLRPVGGNYVNDSDIQRQVENFLPIKIKEFLLYDGESQETFQKLSGPEGNVALKNSIGDLLSVPLIEQASQVLSKQRDDWANKKKKAETHAKSSSQLEKLLLEIAADLAAVEVDRENWKQDIQQTEDTIEDLKEQTSTWEEFQKVTKRVDEAEKTCRQIQIDLETARFKSQEIMSRCFWLPALGQILEAKKASDATSDEYREFEIKRLALDSDLKTYEKLELSPTCPTCHNQHGMAPAKVSIEIERLTKDLRELEQSRPINPLNTLQRINRLNFDPSALDDLVASINATRTFASNLAVAKQEKIKAELHLAQFDASSAGENLQQLNAKYQMAVQHLPLAKLKLAEASRKRDELVLEKGKKSLELARVGGDTGQLTEVSTVQVLLDAVNYGKSVYVNKIREQVEKYASEAFVSLSAQKEKFKGLAINENFGTVPILADGIKQEKWINKGHSKLEAIALVQAMLRVALGKDSFLLMDNPETQLDDVRLESIFRWVAETDLPIGLFVIPDQISGKWRVKPELLKIIQPKISRHYVIWKDPKNTNVSHISEYSEYVKIESTLTGASQ